MLVLRILRWLAVAGLVIAACGSAAWSEEPSPVDASSESPKAPAVEEIVVTASKAGATELMSTAVSAAVLGSETLANRAVRDVQDLQFQVPGLVADTGSSVPRVMIRGVGHDNFLANAESGVVPYLDGVVLTRPQTLLAGYFDLDRVEVLKGPQGSSFGRNAIGGTINYVPRKPEDGFVAEVGSELGNLSRHEYSAVLNYGAPLFGIRAGAMKNEDDGYVKNRVDGKLLNAIDQDHYRAVARLGPWKGLLATALYQRTNEDTNRDGQGIVAAIPTSKPRDRDPNARIVFTSEKDDATYSEVTNPSVDTDLELGMLNLDWDLGDFGMLKGTRITSITAYSDARWTGVLDNDQSDVKYLVSNTTQPSHTISQETVVKSTIGRVQWLVGHYFLIDDVSEKITIDFASGVEPVGGFAFFNDRLSTSSHGVFTDLVLRVTDRIRLLGGYRYTTDSRDAKIDQQFELFPTTVRLSLCNIRLAETFRQQTGHLGIEADLLENLFGYFKASRGFKAGGFNIAGCNNPYDPETLNAYEIGAKGRWLDGALSFTTSAFLYDYKDLQVTAVRPVSGGLLAASSSTVENADGADIRGFDFALQYRAPLDLSFDANLAWLPTAKYRSFSSTDPLAPEYFDSIPTTNPAPIQLKGRRLNRAPELSGTIGANYTRDLLAGWSIDGRLELYSVSQQFYSPYLRPHDENAQGGYQTLNAYLSFRRGDAWTIRAYGKNLTDTFILSGITENSATGHIFVDYGRPREFGVGVTYRFDAPL